VVVQMRAASLLESRVLARLRFLGGLSIRREAVNDLRMGVVPEMPTISTPEQSVSKHALGSTQVKERIVNHYIENNNRFG